MTPIKREEPVARHTRSIGKVRLCGHPGIFEWETQCRRPRRPGLPSIGFQNPDERLATAIGFELYRHPDARIDFELYRSREPRIGFELWGAGNPGLASNCTGAGEPGIGFESYGSLGNPRLASNCT